MSEKQKQKSRREIIEEAKRAALDAAHLDYTRRIFQMSALEQKCREESDYEFLSLISRILRHY